MGSVAVKEPAIGPETPLDFTEEELDVLLNNLDACSPEEIAEIDRMVEELAARKANNRCLYGPDCLL